MTSGPCFSSLHKFSEPQSWKNANYRVNIIIAFVTGLLNGTHVMQSERWEGHQDGRTHSATRSNVMRHLGSNASYNNAEKKRIHDYTADERSKETGNLETKGRRPTYTKWYLQPVGILGHPAHDPVRKQHLHISSLHYVMIPLFLRYYHLKFIFYKSTRNSHISFEHLSITWKISPSSLGVSMLNFRCCRNAIASTAQLLQVLLSWTFRIRRKKFQCKAENLFQK